MYWFNGDEWRFLDLVRGVLSRSWGFGGTKDNTIANYDRRADAILRVVVIGVDNSS